MAFNQLLALPMAALVGLTIFIVICLGFNRFKAAKNKELDIKYYKLYRDGSEPEKIRQLSRNFMNLFETPVLFYVAILATMILQIESTTLLSLAWAYVALRYIHSYVHCTTNKVIVRFRLFLLSLMTLTAYWIIFVIKLVGG